jgi:hypothetical protein
MDREAAKGQLFEEGTLSTIAGESQSPVLPVGSIRTSDNHLVRLQRFCRRGIQVSGNSLASRIALGYQSELIALWAYGQSRNLFQAKFG